MRDRLERARLVLTPHCQPEGGSQGVGVLDPLFFGPASGSVTVATPALRLRTACPVGHHVRVRWNVDPASRSTRQMVNVETLGSPSGAARRTRRRVASDQVAVPSLTGGGVRAASRRMRSRADASYVAFDPPPCRGSRTATPTRLNRATRWDTASPLLRPAARAAPW